MVALCLSLPLPLLFLSLSAVRLLANSQLQDFRQSYFHLENDPIGISTLLPPTVFISENSDVNEETVEKELAQFFAGINIPSLIQHSYVESTNTVVCYRCY